MDGVARSAISGAQGAAVARLALREARGAIPLAEAALSWRQVHTERRHDLLENPRLHLPSFARWDAEEIVRRARARADCAGGSLVVMVADEILRFGGVRTARALGSFS